MLQSDALDILKTGKNVFLTGAPGSGKTHVLRQYIAWLKKQGIGTAITASTGIAATHLGGITIHAWSGIGVKDNITDYDLELMGEKQALWKRFADAKVLIIDEISMLHDYRLDMIDKVARFFRRVEQPFGGMQVVLCGDFFQLPPVQRDMPQSARFCFDSRTWKNSGLKICYLEEQYRQADTTFLSILEKIRANDVDEEVFSALEERYLTPKSPDESDLSDLSSILPSTSEVTTRLFSHNIDVDILNQDEVKKLPGHNHIFQMVTKGKANLVEILKKNCLAPETLLLKVGARVMFVKNNYEKGLANGTLGTVVGFDDRTGMPIVALRNEREVVVESDSWVIEEDGKIKVEIKQLPIRLAWAITIHKSQGMSLDSAEIDLSKSFVAGMGYVALSRVRTLSGLRLTGFSPHSLRVDPAIISFDTVLRTQSHRALAELTEIREGFSDKSVLDMHREFIEKNSNRKSAVDSYTSSDDPELDSIVSDFAQVEKERSTYQKTLDLIKEKKSIRDIAELRGIKEETVLEHIEHAIHTGLAVSENVPLKPYIVQWYKDAKARLRREKIIELIQDLYDKQDEPKKPEKIPLSAIKNALSGSYTYAEIKKARIYFLAELFM